MIIIKRSRSDRKVLARMGILTSFLVLVVRPPELLDKMIHAGSYGLAGSPLGRGLVDLYRVNVPARDGVSRRATIAASMSANPSSSVSVSTCHARQTRRLRTRNGDNKKRTLSPTEKLLSDSLSAVGSES